MTGLHVVQWATGNIGTRSLRHVIEHPELTLAGLYVTSPAKVRVDAGGSNIVTTRGEFHHPGRSARNSPDLLFNLMGYGHPVEEFPPQRFSYLAHSFGPSMRLVAEAIGLPLDSVTSAGEVAVTPEKLTIAAGTLDAGSVAGQRTTVTGTRGGRPVMTFTATWCVSQDLDPAWSLRGAGWNGWNVRVDGDAPLDIDIRFAIPDGRIGEMTPGYTANRAVNAVAYVCAAAPGIRTTVDLPQIIPVL